MSLIKKNIFANLAGRAWNIVLAVAFIPMYLKFLGIEAYGLIGFFATLQGVFGLMDLGFSLTLNRELARLSATEGTVREQRDLVRTLETIYWMISILIAVIVYFLAPVIAERWINPQHLSVGGVEDAVRIMGAVMALQFPFSFYQGGLMGLQRQILLNVLLAVVGTLRGAGAVLVLWLVAPTIQMFFTWQILVAALGTGACAYFLWNSMPDSPHPARFDRKRLVGVWRFAAAVSGNAMIGVLLTQMDKVILSKMLTLEMFGYYALAATVASSVWSIIVPVNTALFPRFTQLVELRDDVQLATTYHRASQFIAVLLLPFSAIIAFFSREVMMLWTHNPVTAENTSTVIALLVIGTTLNGLFSVPAYLQSAAGWPQLVLYTNLVSAVILIPSIIFMTSKFGAVGAALVWVVLNGGYLLFAVPIMHRKLLKGEKWRWYLEDVGIPVSGVLVCGGIARFLLPGHMSMFATTAYLVGMWIVLMTVCALLSRHIREFLFGQLYKIRLADLS